MNIIIVDDAELIRDLVKNMLLLADKEYGVINLIRTAGTSKEVGELLDKDPDVDFFFLDFNLKNETAIDVLRILRSRSEAFVEKTIIVSGRDTDEIERELFQEDFLIPVYSKPINTKFITSILHEYKSFLDGEF